MKKKSITIWVSLLAVAAMLLFLAGCWKKDGDSESWQIEKDYSRGHLSVKMRVENGHVNIAELIKIQFEAAASQWFQITLPNPNGLDDLELYSNSDIERVLDDKGRVQVTRTYYLAPLVPGSYQLPEFTFVFTDSNDPEKSRSVYSEPMTIEVAAVSDPNESQIADIEDILGAPIDPLRVGLFAVPAVFIAGVVSWFIYRRIKKSREKVVVLTTAYDIAVGRLRALEERDLIGAGEIKLFYQHLSDIVRRYIEDRFAIKAPELTTEEFLEKASRSGSLRTEDKDYLADFLAKCDMVKFARHEPDAEDMSKTFDAAENFIELSRDFERTIELDGDRNVGGEVSA
jgi:hypothetical protein